MSKMLLTRAVGRPTDTTKYRMISWDRAGRYSTINKPGAPLTAKPDLSTTHKTAGVTTDMVITGELPGPAAAPNVHWAVRVVLQGRHIVTSLWNQAPQVCS